MVRNKAEEAWIPKRHEREQARCIVKSEDWKTKVGSYSGKLEGNMTKVVSYC